MFTLEALYQTFHQHSLPPRVCVAYSGGLDSHVLLHALTRLRADHPELQLRAAHVNHGLSTNAADWARHCQQVCDHLGVALTIHNIDPKSYDNKSSTEEVARDCRYQIFSDILEAGECLLTAHHQDDQAETVLLRLLRGAGPKGLSAMAWCRSLGKGVLARPLLDTPRADLEAYAQREKLAWIEDESNLSTKIDRNYLRHTVLPLLTARWSGAAVSLSRAARHCREAGQLLEEMAREDVDKAQGSVADTLSLSVLKKLTRPRQKNLVRFWLKKLGFSIPSAKKLHQLLHDCLEAKEDAMPLLTWDGVEVRCFGDDLYAMPPLPPHDAAVVIPWDMQEPLLLKNVGWIRCVFHRNPPDPISAVGGLRQKRPNPPYGSAGSADGSSACGPAARAPGIYLPQDAKVTIRFRQGGEIFHPAGRVGSHPLKKLFQEWHVPPWMRDRIPLLYVDEELAMVVGYAASEKYAKKCTENDKTQKYTGIHIDGAGW